MLFTETRLRGAFRIRLERIDDDRGFFARTYCEREFTARGLNPRVSQSNISFSRRKGTLRGLHYQTAPHAEAKLICCVSGAIYDVIADVRPESPTFLEWVAIELRPDACELLYVPEGFAHGFLALTDDVLVHYQMSECYHPEAARGIRWNDPVLAIEWPTKGSPILSPRDAAWPFLRR